MDLLDPVSSLLGVGPQYSQRLKKLGIQTLADLLYHPPFRYDDLSQTSSLNQLTDGATLTITGDILSIKNIYTKRGKNLQIALFSDGTGTIKVTWFNQPYLTTTFSRQPHCSLSGKIKRLGRDWCLTSPQYELLPASTPDLESLTNTPQRLHTGRLVPIYHCTARVSSKWFRQKIAYLLKHLIITDPLSQLKPDSLLTLDQALQQMHFPSNLSAYQHSHQRLAFDELFYLQLASLNRQQAWQQQISPLNLQLQPNLHQQFIQSLPFQLTSAQIQAINTIFTDLTNPWPMNRLLQGDVGSGKTIVAASAILQIINRGYEAILLAPTAILAKQHHQTLAPLFKPFGYNPSLVTGQQPGQGTGPFFIGTHALLHRYRPHRQLALLIIDEQHRFGVVQRQQLLQQTPVPHLLSMTATPIPRTVALSLYQELKLSVLTELPQGRKPIKTWVIPETKRQQGYSWLDQQIAATQTQAYIICPFITDSENPTLSQVKAVTSEFERLKLVFPHRRLGLLHGSQSAKDKAQIMAAFVDHQLDILVSTPIVEVGIDVKNATIMLIESAERFGLAQLHQLRGRVGRSQDQSYCLLFSSHHTHVPRLKHLETTQSGQTLADLDLKLRGPGNLYGTEQSGYLNLKFASLADLKLLSQVKSICLSLFKQDPQLNHHPQIKQRLETILAIASTPH